MKIRKPKEEDNGKKGRIWRDNLMEIKSFLLYLFASSGFTFCVLRNLFIFENPFLANN